MSAASPSRRPVLIAAVAAVGGFLFGFDTAVINGAVAAIAADFHAGPAATGFTVSAALLGCAAGAYLAGDFSERYGRPRTMVLSSALFIVSGVLSGAARSLVELSAWRLLGGVAIGVASVVAPTYIAEISPARIRGRLASLQQLAIVVGIFAALLGDYALARLAGSASAPLAFGLPAWRWMFWTEVLPAVAYGAGAFLIPESPRWLAARGRTDEARAILVSLGEPADAKLAEMALAKAGSAGHVARLRDLRGPVLGLQGIVWTGLLLASLQQLVGINVIFYYSSVLWQSVGFSEHDALLVTVVTSVTNIVTTFLAIATVDRFGRRPLLLVGSLGMALALGLLAVLFARASVDAAGVHLDRASGVAALLAANVFVFCFGFSWGPVMWVLLGEMFANRIRAKALAVASAVNWIANFVVSVTFPSLQRAGLGLAYGVYALAAAASFVFVLRAVKETKGVELEAM